MPGGTGRYTRELADALVRTATEDSTVQLWTAWHSRHELIAAGLPSARRLPLPRRALVAAWERGLPPAPRGMALVHAPTLLVPRVRVPLVVTIHDTVPWTHPQTLTPRGARWHRRMAERAVSVGAHITVPTQAVADSLAEHGLPIAPDHLHVLGAGVAPGLAVQPTAERSQQVADELQLPPRYVLSLATFEPRKGLDVLFDAMALLGPRSPVLVLVGRPGWGAVDPAAEARRRKLPADRIRVLGPIPDSQLAVVLRRADALVMPSRAEGFGLPIVEAMAVGTPVICSDDPALQEVSGGATLIVPRGQPDPLAAALLALSGDDDARYRLGAAGLVRAADFSWDDVARRAWRLYASLS
ncbi:glycosyltransferase family 1 protein [soil metagenome]